MAKIGAEEIKKRPVEPGKIEVEAISMATIINEKEKNELVANNNARIQSLEVMSQELDEGMIIRAQDGGNPDKTKTSEEGER